MGLPLLEHALTISAHRSCYSSAWFGFLTPSKGGILKIDPLQVYLILIQLTRRIGVPDTNVGLLQIKQKL